MAWNNDLSDVIMISGDFGITYFKTLKTGAVQSTTVARKARQVVHSRHSLIGADEILSSQYYGTCERL